MVKAMNTGLSKGLFTNEAGMGTSPIFDVMVNEKDIKKQSIISSTSVFIDTVLLCTLTGIVFVASGMYTITENPALIANYTYDLVKEFNSFYQQVSILGEENHDKKVFRVQLSKSVGNTIKNAFQLLGIEVPERM